MSYEIIKCIKIDHKDKKVHITSAESNSRPLVFSENEATFLSRIFRAQGEIELIKEILYFYWSGLFQGGGNNFEKSLKLLSPPRLCNWDFTDGLSEHEIENKKVFLKNILYENYTKIEKTN